jgi:hypothetical protein
VRDGRPQAAPAPATSAFAREIGGGSGLVNENEFRRIEIQPPELTANALMADTRLPLEWSAQRAALGFPAKAVVA